MSWIVQLVGKTVAEAEKEVLDAGMQVIVMNPGDKGHQARVPNRVKLYVENGEVKRAIIG